jgi:hypothetical protein
MLERTIQSYCQKAFPFGFGNPLALRQTILGIPTKTVEHNYNWNFRLAIVLSRDVDAVGALDTINPNYVRQSAVLYGFEILCGCRDRWYKCKGDRHSYVA